ncbi:MAG: 30S ribosomal protein S6 [Oscillospiraceae bacterium]|jgi:small subunit ribosomal protein S6|nr:30S ribosomal protein S6 [Oscillospiraceae bacterium]
MAEIKHSYEFMLVISSKLSEDSIGGVINKFKELIEKNAQLENIDKWGKRKLAYLINKESEGIYILFNFKSNSEFPAELDRISKITDGILRSLIVKKEN